MNCSVVVWDVHRFWHVKVSCIFGDEGTHFLSRFSCSGAGLGAGQGGIGTTSACL